eukprot:tig00020554_g10875.t1
MAGRFFAGIGNILGKGAAEKAGAEAASGAAGKSPFPFSLPPGVKMEDVAKMQMEIMKDPKLVEMMRNPKFVGAMQNMMKDPSKAMEYLRDPEVLAVVQRFEQTFKNLKPPGAPQP